MSLDPKYNKRRSAKVSETLKNLDELDQIAIAAGHGHSQIGREHNAGWVEVQLDEANTRPSYDLRFIRTFTPEVVHSMLYELSLARKLAADLQKTLG